jgi:hypothetical protein
MVVRNAFAELAQEHATSHGDAHLVGGSKIKWRREFNNPNADFWDIITATPGITIPDPSNGSIVVAMGTTINAEVAMVSKEIFNFPLKAAVALQLSQKIAQNEIYVEIIGCDEQGNVDETRVAAWRVAGSDSTTVTIARSEVRNGAAARRQSGNLTVASLTAAPSILEITAESDEVWFSSKAADSTAARNVATVMNLVAPDPEGLYKLRIRFKNGATAPASSTNVTLSFALAVDYTEQQVEVTGGNGNSQPGQSIPVSVVNGGGVASPSLAASASVAGLNASKILAAATTNPVNLKTTAARLYGYQLANLSAAWKFVRLYNKASAPTVGTDAPLFVVALPPNASIDLNLATPISFALGLGYSITGAVADLDTTAVAANDVQGTLLWI